MSRAPSEGRDAGSAWLNRFRRGETLNDGFQRILGGLTTEMVSYLDEPDAVGADAAIHEVRRRGKQARAMLRLVRPSLGDDFKGVDRLYRDAGRLLAPARDARVLVDTLDTLESDGDTNSLRERLDHRATGEAATVFDSHEGTAASARVLLKRGRQAASVTAVPEGPDAVANGAARTYAEGLGALNRLLSGDDGPAVFHRWRIRVKQRRHQVAFIEDWDPSILTGLHDDLYELSDLLGDAHDLVVFREHLSEAPGFASEPGARRLTEVADHRRSSLEKRAIASGAPLYESDAETVRTSLVAAWATWMEPQSRS